MRDQITPWFSPGAVAQMEPFVRHLARELLDGVGAQARVDIALDYSILPASLTMLRLVGFSESTEPSIQHDIDLLLRSPHDPEALQAAGALARMELRVGLGELLDRFPDYAIDGPVLWGFGENRGVRSLPVSTATSAP